MPRTAPLRDRPNETEKVTLNIGYVDLGRIDLLVREGFYSNRADFLRTAIRNQIASHDAELKRSLAHHALDLGLRRYSRADLEAAAASGKPLAIRVLGLAAIDHDVPAELARAAIASVTVLGALDASKDVRAALADRIR